MRRPSARVLVASALLVTASGLSLMAPAASAAPPDPDKASCVEQFNLAVGTPGEFQRVFHVDKLGRDVSFFARFPKATCPF
jgi:Spy/CpxP family protein refolding chaperone